MRILAIDTATEACSVALFDAGKLIAHDHRELGRGHAERLIPMIEALPDRGRAERILVSLGPGSFTGVRIGIAAARALGIAWKAQVLGYPTLALVAAMARQNEGLDRASVTVCMNGGHGEWFVQDFGADGCALGDAASLTPEAAQARHNHSIIAGNRAQALADILPNPPATVLQFLPNTAHALALPDACLTDQMTPIYGRGPDAKPQQMVKRP